MKKKTRRLILFVLTVIGAVAASNPPVSTCVSALVEIVKSLDQNSKD